VTGVVQEGCRWDRDGVASPVPFSIAGNKIKCVGVMRLVVRTR